MPSTLILEILATVVGMLDMFVQRASTWMIAAFEAISIDVWVIIVIIGCTVIIIIVIVIRTSRRQ
jgi:hypothetical protein